MSEVTFLNVFCDGGSRSNPGPAACAFVVKDNDGKIIYQETRFLNISTNNVAEYQGVILALKWLAKNIFKSTVINIFLDSKLIVNQLNGRFKIKNPLLRELILEIKILETNLNHSQISYYLIKREQNTTADLLVNQTLDKQLIFTPSTRK